MFNSVFMKFLAPTLVEVVATIEAMTSETIRLYVVEGPWMSHKSSTRITWYTSPTTATEIGHYMGGTRRVMYVDLQVSVFSDLRFQHYGLDNAAYILHGETMKQAKRRCKPYKEAI